MADPINKTYLDKIDARLKLITTTNEYANTIKRVERARLKPFKGYDLPAINYWPVNLANSTDQYGMDTRENIIFVEAHTKTRDEPFTDICDVLAKDIVTALNRAPANPKVSDSESIDLGGVVENFNFLGFEYQIANGQTPFCGILAQFLMRYITDLNNM
jgi:hypothetical protein